MPFPDRLARFNRRVTNPIMRLYAGRIPPLAVVVHRGRRSDQVYRTPVLAFSTPDGFAIALTYGSDTDWVHNVLAADGCALERRGRTSLLTGPRLHDRAGLRLLPAPFARLLPLLGTRDVLTLTRRAG